MKRRQILQATGGAGLLAIAAAAFATPNTVEAGDSATGPATTDAALIALCRQLVSVEAEQSEVTARYARVRPGTEGYAALQARHEALGVQSDRLAWHIGQMPPATTAAGIRARAVALQAFAPIDYGTNDLVPIGWHCGMLDALLRDVMAGGVA